MKGTIPKDMADSPMNHEGMKFEDKANSIYK